MQRETKNKIANNKKFSVIKLWRNIKYRKKIILYTSIVLYVFLVFFGVLIYGWFARGITNVSEQQTIQQLENFDEEVKSKFSMCSSVAASLLLNQSFQDKLELCPSSFIDVYAYDKEIIGYLDSLCESVSYVRDWKIYYTDERPTSIYEEISTINKIQDTEWYQKITSKGRNTITWSIEQNTADGSRSIICAVGIKNRGSGVIPAYFEMTILPSQIFSSVKKVADVLNGEIIVCDQSGGILWCSETNYLEYTEYIIPYEQIELLKPVVINGNQGKCTVIALDGGKHEYMMFFVRKVVPPIVRYLDVTKYFLLILSLIIVLSLFALMFSAKFVDGRIVALTADVKAIDENNLNFHANTSDLDEVGELSRAFSGLVKRIKELLEKEHKFEEERFELEVQALQMQISPHFLFNTLSIINVLAKEIEADHISESLEALANFYYFSLNDSKKVTTIRDELTRLDSYFKICLIRYRNRLNVCKDVDSRTLDLVVPKLIIQPFCENAVFHGFSAQIKEEPKLNISIRLEDDNMLIEITDNGKGMTEDEIKQAMKKGFTITKINRRIQMFYGNQYGVSIYSDVGSGTRVCIKLGKEIPPMFGIGKDHKL